MTDHFLIFVSDDSHPLTESFLTNFRALLGSHYIISLPQWLKPNKAYEVKVSDILSPELFQNIQKICHDKFVDVFMVPAANRRKKLFLADMDATIVEGETLDDLAGQVGLKEKIAEITARAMRGELDFQRALEQRVGMLKDLPISALEDTLSLMKINQGAIDAVRVMREHGTECYLVSGGFTYFTGAIAKLCGFHGHHGNQLGIEKGHLTGSVLPPILDKEAKLRLLRSYTAQLEIQRDDTMAVGDGANDIPMLLEAGTGVGYYPKALVREQISNIIVHTDLTSLLYIQGYSWQDIAI